MADSARSPTPSPAARPATGRDVYTVTRLNNEVRALLEGNFPRLWIEGEISNLSRPRSGHLYFSLKDQSCQVRCAMFRSQNRHLDFEPADGQQVLVHARVGLYMERGEFQLILEYMEQAGAGALRRAFEALKQRLAAEGLFDEARKRPIPTMPRCVGVVTSPTAAALRDVVSVFARRFPALPLVVYPIPVQGAGAAPEIARVLGIAGRRGECDALLLTRGGGSIEDLWPFNEEIVARAIRACPLPVVTGIGHEIDFTIADFAADRRAPTPSAAAEMLSPDQREVRERLADLVARLRRRADDTVRGHRQRVAWLVQRLGTPRRRVQELIQRVDRLTERLARAIRILPAQKRSRLRELTARLAGCNPAVRLHARRIHHQQLRHRLHSALRHALDERHAALRARQRTLEAVSPLRTLDRGYAIVTREDAPEVLRSSEGVRTGERIRARLANGALTARVEKKEDPA